MLITYAFPYCHFSLIFTITGLLLQSVLCLRTISAEHLTARPHGKEAGPPQPAPTALSHLSPERILHPNYYRLFKL